MQAPPNKKQKKEHVLSIFERCPENVIVHVFIFFDIKHIASNMIVSKMIRHCSYVAAAIVCCTHWLCLNIEKFPYFDPNFGCGMTVNVNPEPWILALWNHNVYKKIQFEGFTLDTFKFFMDQWPHKKN